MKHISIKRIAQLLGAACENESQVTGYQIDSRKIEPQELFFALKGKRADGHEHLAEVKMRGGVGAVVSKRYRGPDYGLILLFVEDVVFSLQDLARRLMLECKSQVIGITGSVGKTTSKEFIATLLEGKFKVGKTHLNYNTKLTYPITLLNRNGDEDVLVVELGMTEPGDIQRLVQIAAPHIALLTKIAYAHAANFKDLSDIAKNKAAIFTHPKTKMAIFDHNLYEYSEAISMIHGDKVSFSLIEKNADLFLSNEYFIDEKGIRAYHFDPLYQQTHLLHNFLAAVSVARAMRMSWDEINRQIPLLQLPKMRFEQIEKEGIVFINDAYNANPESMRAALSHLPSAKNGGKRIAVLGMMVDMGEEHDRIHWEMGKFAAGSVDYLLTIGKEARPLLEGFQEGGKPAEGFEDFELISQRLKDLMRPGDVVLVKGSRCVQMEKLFSLLCF